MCIINFWIFLISFLSGYSINMGRYKAWTSKEESKGIIEFLTKERNIKNYKSKSRDRLYNIFKKTIQK